MLFRGRQKAISSFTAEKRERVAHSSTKDFFAQQWVISIVLEREISKKMYITEETKTGAEQGKRRKIMVSCQNYSAIFCAYRKQEEKRAAFGMKTWCGLCDTKTRPENTCCTLCIVMKMPHFQVFL